MGRGLGRAVAHARKRSKITELTGRAGERSRTVDSTPQSARVDSAAQRCDLCEYFDTERRDRRRPSWNNEHRHTASDQSRGPQLAASDLSRSRATSRSPRARGEARSHGC